MLVTEAMTMTLSAQDIDMDKVKKLRARPDLIQAVHAWTILPDRELIPRLVELGKLVNALYTQPKELQLFRGFNIGGIQEALGIQGVPHVGQTVSFKSDDRALSFSKEIDISKSFGGVVVCAHFKTQNTVYLDITPELCYLIAEKFHLKRIDTQHEVVIMPPVDFNAMVVQAKRGWLPSW